MPVTKLTIHLRTTAPKARPRIGDRKVIRGVLHVRTQDVARDPTGRVIGSLVDGRGRPMCSWVSVPTLPGADA